MIFFYHSGRPAILPSLHPVPPGPAGDLLWPPTHHHGVHARARKEHGHDEDALQVVAGAGLVAQHEQQRGVEAAHVLRRRALVVALVERPRPLCGGARRSAVQWRAKTKVSKQPYPRAGSHNGVHNGSHSERACVEARPPAPPFAWHEQSEAWRTCGGPHERLLEHPPSLPLALARAPAACYSPSPVGCHGLAPPTWHLLHQEVPRAAGPVRHDHDEEHEARHKVQVGMAAPLQGGHAACTCAASRTHASSAAKQTSIARRGSEGTQRMCVFLGWGDGLAEHSGSKESAIHLGSSRQPAWQCPCCAPPA